MKDLEESEVTLLQTISNRLNMSVEPLLKLFKSIKSKNEATEEDLAGFMKLNISVYQGLFNLFRNRELEDTRMTSTLTFAETKILLFSMIQPGGLLNPESDSLPRFTFSSGETIEIKSFLRLAKNYNRRDRQEILKHLRQRFGFFPSSITKSRNRFDDESFDYYVSQGKIHIVG